MRSFQRSGAIVAGTLLLAGLTGCSPDVRGAVGVTVDAAARLTVVVWDCDPAAPVDLSVHQVQPGATEPDQPVADLHAARGAGNLLEVTLAEPPPGWSGQRGPAGVDALDPQLEYLLWVRIAKKSWLDSYGYRAGSIVFSRAMVAGLRGNGQQALIHGVASGMGVRLTRPIR